MEYGIIEFMEKKFITACNMLDGIVYVAMKPIIESMGLNWGAQHDKLIGDSRYTVISIPYKTTGGTQEMLSLQADHLPAFLYSINPNKVRKDLRETIIAFQSETFGVINAYWNKKKEIKKQNVIRGYKSQIAQHNKKIEEVTNQLVTTRKLYETCLKKPTPSQDTFRILVEEHDQLQHENFGLRRALMKSEQQQQKAKKSSRVSDSDIFMNDASMHNNFLDFLYVGNMAVHQVGALTHLSKELKDTHQSMGNFMLFIMKRYDKILGVDSRIKELAM